MRISLPSRVNVFALALLSIVAVALFALALPSGARAAEACPNEQLRQESRLNGVTGVHYSAELPDCRAFEMVTPVEKGQGGAGGLYSGDEPSYQASVEGEGFMYSTTNPLLDNASGPIFSQYVASRGKDAWSTMPLDAAQQLLEYESSDVDEFLYFSPTLSCGLDETEEARTELPAGEQAGEVQNLFVLDTATGTSRLVSDTDPPNRINISGLHTILFHVDGASANCERVVFATEYQLLAGAPAGKLSLYEWNEGALSLVSKLPDGTVAAVTQSNGKNSLVGTVAGEGSQIAFSALSDTTSGGPGEIDSGKEEVFVREGGTTVEASKSKTATPDAGAGYQMGFGEGSAEGFQVLFTANYGLTTHSSTGASACVLENLRAGGGNKSGCDLYDYDVATKTLTDLSADSNSSDTEGADVFGVFGAGAGSEGSYVYFSAAGQLVPGKGNTEAVNKSAGEANIYVAHGGQLEYIATIPQGTTSTGNKAGMYTDLIASGSHYTGYLARTTPSGDSLMFADEGSEVASVTDGGYNNTSPNGEAQNELYLYSAQTKSTVCISCDPTGERPVNGEGVTSNYGINNGYSSRSLSEDGESAFFTASDELTPRAVATGAARNAYEWEREGSDASCPVEEHPASSHGCVFLLATESSFDDASADGSEVFIYTKTPLVEQDLDGVADYYDAKVDGGYPAPAVAQCSGEECQGGLNGSLGFQAPASAGAPKVGNASVQPEVKAAPKTVKPKALTRAQKLAKALKACRKKSKKRKREACESLAKKKFGTKVKAKSKASASKGDK